MAEQIYELIGKAMTEIRAIGKDATATNYNGKVMYKFRGIDAVYNALNPVMAKLGLFIIPETLEQRREERQSTTGTTLIYSIVTVRFTMFAPDGSSVSGTVIGEGMDSGDKSTNKAMSAALKYFCFQAFMIPTEEMRDPDAEVHEVTPRAKNENVSRDVPAEVTTTSALPGAKPSNPVLKYIANEQKFMASRLGITDAKEMKAWFAERRKQLIESGAVEDIAADKLTRAQAESLCEAIYKTFLSEAS